MEKKNKAVSKIADATSKIVALLEPLESDERHRAIEASLTILEGESRNGGSSSGGSATVVTSGASAKHDAEASGLPQRAQSWMKQNGLGAKQVEQVFDTTNGEIIGAVPGNSKKEKTLNTYVLVGISGLLKTGNATFDDKTARIVCQNVGCYDGPNHAATMGAKGNELSGSKDKGWNLTAPGLKCGADLVKQIAGNE